MNDVRTSTIQLEPEKARKVNTALDLIARTARDEMNWTRRNPETVKSIGYMIASGFTPRLYGAKDGEGDWWLTITQPFSARAAEVELSRRNRQGELLYKIDGIAALDGLAAIVEKTVMGEEDRKLKSLS